MASRSDPPLKTLLKLVAVGVLGYLAYEYVYVRGVLQSTPQAAVAQEVLEEIREAILTKFEDDGCIKSLENPHFRHRQNDYSIRFTLTDGCRDEARRLCEDIAELAEHLAGERVSVFAYDAAGNLVAKHVE